MPPNVRFDHLRVMGSGHWFRGIAGENLTDRQLVRIGADGNLYRANASAVGTLPVVGMVTATVTTGQHVRTHVKGFIGLSTWTWTPGGRLYASNTAGGMTQVAGTVTQEVGVAYSATQIYFNPQGLDTGAAAAGGFGGDPDFIPAPDPDSYIGQHAAMRLTDAQDVTVRMEFLLPTDYVAATWSVDVIIIPGGTGNLRRGVVTDFGLICAGEAYNANQDSIAAGVVAVTANEIECIDITAALTGSTALDLVGMEFTRTGSHGDDTVNADCYFIGVVIRRP